jgi:hypothetical protein
MKYFIDCEFIEGFHKPLFGKKRHFIDLISIGIVAEDGREYYAISTEFNEKDADDWVKENVISKLPARYVSFPEDSCGMYTRSLYWKSNERIKDEIIKFISNPACISDLHAGLWPDMDEVATHNPNKFGVPQPEIYAYYADYDWVVFCSLFGRMIDLPKGFPMYCKDLKQMMDDRELDGNWKQMACPEPKEEHNALEDARWNYNLYKAIINESK